MCKLSMFYSFTYEYIQSMDADIFMMYINGMNQLENEILIKDFTVAAYPNMKNDDRKSLHKTTYKCAFPLEFSKPKNVVKLSDLKKVLR